MTIFDSKERFGLLFKLMSGLLSIPCSKADSERGFSMLRKIHTDQRACLGQTTMVSLMSLKFNCDNWCSDQIFDEELLTKCKKPSVNYLRLNKMNKRTVCQDCITCICVVCHLEYIIVENVGVPKIRF